MSLRRQLAVVGLALVAAVLAIFSNGLIANVVLEAPFFTGSTFDERDEIVMPLRTSMHFYECFHKDSSGTDVVFLQPSQDHRLHIWRPALIWKGRRLDGNF